MSMKDPYSMTVEEIKRYLADNYSVREKITGDGRDFVHNLRKEVRRPVFQADVGNKVDSEYRGSSDNPRVEIYELPQGKYVGVEMNANVNEFEITENPHRFIEQVFTGYRDGLSSYDDARFEYNIKYNRLGFYY